MQFIPVPIRIDNKINEAVKDLEKSIIALGKAFEKEVQNYKIHALGLPIFSKTGEKFHRAEIERIERKREEENMISYRDYFNMLSPFVLPKEKKFDKFDFDIQIENQKRPGKNSKKKKVWEKPRFERKCK